MLFDLSSVLLGILLLCLSQSHFFFICIVNQGSEYILFWFWSHGCTKSWWFRAENRSIIIRSTSNTFLACWAIAFIACHAWSSASVLHWSITWFACFVNTVEILIFLFVLMFWFEFRLSKIYHVIVVILFCLLHHLVFMSWNRIDISVKKIVYLASTDTFCTSCWTYLFIDVLAFAIFTEWSSTSAFRASKVTWCCTISREHLRFLSSSGTVIPNFLTGFTYVFCLFDLLLLGFLFFEDVVSPFILFL